MGNGAERNWGGYGGGGYGGGLGGGGGYGRGGYGRGGYGGGRDMGRGDRSDHGRERNRDSQRPSTGEQMNREDTDKLFLECVKVRCQLDWSSQWLFSHYLSLSLSASLRP
jgi:hypothetical protein